MAFHTIFRPMRDTLEALAIVALLYVGGYPGAAAICMIGVAILWFGRNLP